MPSKSNFQFFRSSFLFLIAGVLLAGFIGAWDRSLLPHLSPPGSASQFRFLNPPVLRAALEAGFIALVLAVLEISLSFDNAIVNASILQNMSALWRRRFITWGMFFAVFIMRLLFPLLIVAVIARVGPIAAFKLAVFDPGHYASVMQLAHVPVSAFGGTFLLLAALQFFTNEERDGLWIKWLERPLARVGRVPFAFVGVTVLILLAFGPTVERLGRLDYVAACAAALTLYLLIHLLSTRFAASQGKDRVPPSNRSTTRATLERASIGMFIYLEILDASFSFDGVIGAFAITNHLLIITIGLSIGALFVRSLTLLMVERGALTDYIFLESGAFYAIGVLGLMLLIGLAHRIPELVTGLSGLLIITFAWHSSYRHNRFKKMPGPQTGA